MKARLCESTTICVKITQNSDTRAKLIAILDNTGQPALIQASRHACVKNPQYDYKQIYVCITAFNIILLRASLL